eukprot:CAMPEP_0175664898 /NCGR_PEP_ID=MMETSP0097-20121207/16772_1 /TAXON_ID=311494 /ORGANISM="Alexandrium monilatum, Strain CCMP3105" /LENGTH=172 /DNA_ID=CAMNT_0016971237 /DNA_START=79 /DNA_END=593 /DNA_ORIENTATION=+
MRARAAPPQRTAGSVAVLALCAALVQLWAHAWPTFSQPWRAGGAAAPPGPAVPLPRGVSAGPAAAGSADGATAAAPWGSRLGVAAAAAACLWAAGLLAPTPRDSRGSAKGSVLAEGARVTPTPLADVLDTRARLADDSQPRVIMFGVKHRPHVRIAKRTYKDWLRGRRRNSA